ncbi:META domain-containing protein [Chloroflexota bacterium]
MIKGSRVSAEFDGADKQVTGSAGCNHYFGGYTLDDNQISISQIGNTEMACMDPEGVMDQEQEYLRLLGKAESFRIEDENLRVNCAGGILDFSIAED